jgi:hypothetical protein
MNTAIASSRRSVGARKILGCAYRSALSAAAIATFALSQGGCSKSNSSPDAGAANGINTCAANVGNTTGNAVPVKSGTSYEAKLCYAGTPNWFSINVPTGSTLLDVTAGYPMSAGTMVELEAKLFYKTNSTTLTQVNDVVAPARSDAGGTGTIQTTLLVAQPGDYYLEIVDAHNSAFDANDAYSFELTTAQDPDTHEPNDTIAEAKPTDSNPGWLAYMGDLDVFSTSVSSATQLLTLTVNNPATAASNILFQITSSSGSVIASGEAPAVAMPTSTVFPTTAADTYYVTLSYPPGTIPDRKTADGYTISFGATMNPDTAATNHTIATAICPGGGSGANGTGPCTMAYSGTALTLPSEQGFLAVPGQRDFYRIDVTNGAAAVLQINLKSSSTTVQYAVNLLTSDPGSSCTQDSDCAALDQPCTPESNPNIVTSPNCELPHVCLKSIASQFCSKPGASCALCEGAGLCIPNGSSGGSCAVGQYLSDYSASGVPVGAPNVSTAQPLFTNGTYYLVVHDSAGTNFDDTNPYTLSLQIVPEPDPNDKSTTPSMRNNFYNPYPGSLTDLTPSSLRAIDITDQVREAADGGTPTPITGYISYQADEDWFKFQHPCPGSDCGISFAWLQPGPSPVQVGFFMLNQDLTDHESFAYSGTTPVAQLSGPQTGTFDNANGDCTQCSFASSTVTTADAGTPYYYYMRVTDVGQQDWDFTSTGQYNFSITAITHGCPESCSQTTSGTCVCWCKDTMMCPAPTF